MTDAIWLLLIGACLGAPIFALIGFCFGWWRCAIEYEENQRQALRKTAENLGVEHFHRK